jgi:hypothetical protein
MQNGSRQKPKRMIPVYVLKIKKKKIPVCSAQGCGSGSASGFNDCRSESGI